MIHIAGISVAFHPQTWPDCERSVAIVRSCKHAHNAALCIEIFSHSASDFDGDRRGRVASGQRRVVAREVRRGVRQSLANLFRDGADSIYVVRRWLWISRASFANAGSAAAADIL